MPDENVQTEADAWLAEPLREGQAPAPTPGEELRNLAFETVEQCAKRMLVEHAREGRRIAVYHDAGGLTGFTAGEGLSTRAAARMTAEGVARSWRLIGNDRMADFYGRVAATLSEG